MFGFGKGGVGVDCCVHLCLKRRYPLNIDSPQSGTTQLHMQNMTNPDCCPSVWLANSHNQQKSSIVECTIVETHLHVLL